MGPAPSSSPPRSRKNLMNLAELTDEQLVTAFATADDPQRQHLFAVVVDRHLKTVIRYCAHRLREWANAEDAAHDTFADAYRDLCAGKPVRTLNLWLIGIANHRCNAYRRGDSPTEIRRRSALDLLTPDGITESGLAETLDQLENLSRRRQAEVDRLLGIVVATLTERQQRLFELIVRRGCVGQALAEQLGTTSAQASRHTYDIIKLVDDGFGALVLARDGRRYCTQLAAILDTAPGSEFTTELRNRVLRHFGTCATCDHCGTCITQRRHLVGFYAPILIPVLILATTRDRIERSVRPTAFTTPPSPPGFLPSPPPPALQPPRQRAKRRNPALLLLPLLLVLGATAAIVIIKTQTSPANGALASLAGTWTLDAFNEPGSIGPGRTPSWSFTGSCDNTSSCQFTWLPLTSTTTFESEFTSDFHNSANQQPVVLNKPADLIVRPTGDGTNYTGQATAQYGIVDVQSGQLSTAQETVILNLHVAAAGNDPAGHSIATRLDVSVDFAAHDFDPCSGLCGRQSFNDLHKVVTSEATRSP